MSYTPPFIPRADGAFLLWAQAYCKGLNTSPAAYMLVPAQTQDLMKKFNVFSIALGRATNEETRKRGTICAKDDARSILTHAIRQYAAFIRCNDGITDGDKINIGVRPRNIAHNERTCPTSTPLLQFIGSIPGVDELRYHDSNTPNSKTKPYGAERLELWRAYSRIGEPPPKVSEASLVGSFKKSKMIVDQDRERDSRMEGECKPTYWARWAGFDGTVGPWSLACRPSSLKKKPAKTATDAEKTAKPEQAANADDDQSLPPLRVAA